MGSFKRSRDFPPAAVAAFAVMTASPGLWFDLTQLAAVTSHSRSAIGKHFDELVKLGALRSTTAHGPRSYMLCPHWPFCDWAAQLHRAANPVAVTCDSPPGTS